MSCGKQYDSLKVFFRSEFATDEYCMSCSEDAHRNALYENGLDAEYIEKEMKRLKGNGFELIKEHYSKGADNKLVCFLHPRSTNGVLIELCQEQPQ